MYVLGFYVYDGMGDLYVDGLAVFKAARDSSRAMREWMGEAKKRS